MAAKILSLSYAGYRRFKMQYEIESCRIDLIFSCHDNRMKVESRVSNK